MCYLFLIVIFTTTLLYPRTPKTSPNLFNLSLKFWTLLCPTIWILLTSTSIMAASERGCCVPKCGRTRKDDTVLHSFPNPDKDMARYHAWAQAIGIDTTLEPQYVYRNRRVCHLHLETKFLTWSRRLSSDAIPTLLVPGAEITRLPLANVTNRIDNIVVQEDPLPSTSAGPEMIELLPGESVKYVSENDFLHAAIPSTSQGTPSQFIGKRPHLKAKRHIKQPASQEKSLLAAVKKLEIKKDSYQKRLKKALNLSENRTFQNTIKKFTTLAAMFTVMQFREIGKKKMGRRFTDPEKIMALGLYKRSPRTYRWLQKIFVLPSSMTLNRLIASANIKPGLNENLFLQLKKSVDKMKNDEKFCILLFDEMALAPHFDYNPRKDEISGFVHNGRKRDMVLADHALVFMIRGVLKNYKQPIAYMFCSGSTKSMDLTISLKDVIKKLHSVGLHVLATVCDQGTTNVSAINSLINKTKEKYLRNNEEFNNNTFEVDDQEIVPLYDPPHLIKGIRNNLMNKNLTCTINGTTKTAKWEHIVKLYEEDPAYKGIRLIKKLTKQHIEPDKFQKMKVKFATQVLSQKVAATMGFLAEKKILPSECTETADIILFFDEVFDSLNGSFENSKKRSGKDLLLPVTPKSDHALIWSKAKKVISTMKFVNKNDSKTGKVPTINNLLRTINNVEYLTQKLFTKYNIKSVWMRHFNQDPLENFFGSIRSHGCRNNNPTVAGFESSFTALLINNLSGQHSPGSNCEEDSCKTVFSNMETLFQNKETVPIHTDIEIIDEEIFTDLEEKKNNPRILASLQYVTGYLLKKTKTKVFKNCKICKKCFYDNNKIDYLNLREYKKGKRYLTYPNQNLICFFSRMQDIITHLIKKQCISKNIKTFLKTYLYMELDLDFCNCNVHKTETLEFMIDLACNFFLNNWCRDVNKIINGTRLEVDSDDFIKKAAFTYYNKKKHYKKITKTTKSG